MKRTWIILAVIAAAAGTVVLKKSRSDERPPPLAAGGLPRLLDLGSKGCLACKMLEPELEALRDSHAGRLQIDFIDVHEQEDAARQYGIELIPVQIFYDAQGRELFRHEGFITAEDILVKFREAGIDLDAG